MAKSVGELKEWKLLCAYQLEYDNEEFKFFRLNTSSIKRERISSWFVATIHGQLFFHNNPTQCTITDANWQFFMPYLFLCAAAQAEQVVQLRRIDISLRIDCHHRQQFGMK